MNHSRSDHEDHDLAQTWKLATEGDAASVDAVLDGLQAPGPARAALLRHVHAAAGKAHRIGLAGPPRAGKSTLLTQLAAHHAARGERVGIVSIDATGGNGGSLLGERMKMNALEMSADILLRSLAVGPRSEDPALLAGLLADGMDALGCDRVLLESVGMGRAQLDVVQRSDTVVLLVPPDVEDPAQLLAAGLLTTADVIAVNKLDQEGAAELRQTLMAGADALEIPAGGWRPRVLGTSARRGEGLDELVAAIAEHRRHLEASKELAVRRTRAARAQLLALLLGAVRERLSNDAELGQVLDAVTARVVERSVDAATAAAELAARIELPRG